MTIVTVWFLFPREFKVVHDAQEIDDVLYQYTFLLLSKNSSLKLEKDFKRFALIPRGGSTVILLPFWRTGTGNFGLGMLVSHKRKSLWTWGKETVDVMRKWKEKVHIVFVSLTLTHSNTIHRGLNIENFPTTLIINFSTKSKWKPVYFQAISELSMKTKHTHINYNRLNYLLEHPY